MIFLVHYLKNKREINSLRPHQPNTEHLSSCNRKPNSANVEWTMMCPRDVIIHHSFYRKRHREVKLLASCHTAYTCKDPDVLTLNLGWSAPPCLSASRRRQHPSYGHLLHGRWRQWSSCTFYLCDLEQVTVVQSPTSLQLVGSRWASFQEEGTRA